MCFCSPTGFQMSLWTFAMIGKGKEHKHAQRSTHPGWNIHCSRRVAVPWGGGLFQAELPCRCSCQSPGWESSTEASYSFSPSADEILKRTESDSSQRCPLICNIASTLHMKYCLFLQFLLSLVTSILGLLFLPLSPFAIQEFKTWAFHKIIKTELMPATLRCKDLLRLFSMRGTKTLMHWAVTAERQPGTASIRCFLLALVSIN